MLEANLSDKGLRLPRILIFSQLWQNFRLYCLEKFMFFLYTYLRAGDLNFTFLLINASDFEVVFMVFTRTQSGKLPLKIVFTQPACWPVESINHGVCMFLCQFNRLQGTTTANQTT